MPSPKPSRTAPALQLGRPFTPALADRGETVLLNAVEDRAREMRWEDISETASPGLVDRITNQHLPGILRNLDSETVRRRLTALNISPGPLGSGGADWSTIETHVTQAGLRNQIELLTDLLVENESGLLITLDEVHHKHIGELRALATTIQHTFRDGRELVFVGAGLSSAVSDVINDEVLTFLRRADRRHLGPVRDKEVKRAIQEPVELFGRAVGEDALAVMAEGTGGYPFLIQLVGYRTWRLHPNEVEISVEDADEGVRQARRRLGSLVYEPALADASDVDRTFLLAMAKDDGPSRMSEIQRRLGVDESYISQYRLASSQN
jgi:hypothetical protein